MAKYFFASVLGILSIVLIALGAGMLIASIVLMVFVPTLPVGLILLLVSVTDLTTGILMGAFRLSQVRRRMRLGTDGGVCQGTVASIERNLRLRVNRKHPWLIHYSYQVAGQQYEGSDNVFSDNPDVQAGSPIDVAYDRSHPATSALKKYLT